MGKLFTCLGRVPVGGKPLKSVTYGQCDARPTVTFPAAGHNRPLTGAELYCLVTEARVRVNNLPKVVIFYSDTARACCFCVAAEPSFKLDP